MREAEKAQKTPQQKLDQRKSWFYMTMTVIGVCVIVYIIYIVCGKFRSLIETLLLIGIFSFILRRPVAWLERHGIKRGWGAIISIIMAMAVLVGVAFIIFPPIFRQLGDLLYALPTRIEEMTDAFNTFYNEHQDLFTNSDVQDAINSAITSLVSWVRNTAPQIGQSIITYGTITVKTIVTVIMSIVATFWILKDMPRIGHEIRVMAGPAHSLDLELTRAIGARVFGGYIRGLVIASTCTGVFAGTGFMIIGLPYAGLLGLVTGLLNIIPYIGPWTGGALAALVGLFVSPLAALGAIIVSIVAQQVTDIFITPRVYGTTVELHPALIIIALSAGEVIGGVIGMIAAVPVTAAIKAIIVYRFERQTGRQLVSANGAFFKGRPSDAADGIDPAYDATGGTVDEDFEFDYGDHSGGCGAPGGSCEQLGGLGDHPDAIVELVEELVGDGADDAPESDEHVDGDAAPGGGGDGEY